MAHVSMQAQQGVTGRRSAEGRAEVSGNVGGRGARRGVGRSMGVGAVALLAATGLGCAAGSIGGCADPATDPTVRVDINGHKFDLELALDDATRAKGLGQRTHIDPAGGMMFVFTSARPPTLGFVMRDCPIPIDIIYLSRGGRVLNWHQMQPVPPRDEAKGEGKVGDFNNQLYESRLKSYPANAEYQFVIELAGGTIPKLNLKEGQLIDFSRDVLVKRAR